MSPYLGRAVERLGEAERELAPARPVRRGLPQSVPAYIRDGSVRSLLTAPVIYSLLVPLALLDAWVTFYQRVCFPIYGIARVRRSEYFVIDRHTLAYLNAIEKINCTFCSYANGVLAYVREVAACTEQYWCPIKHGRAVPKPHLRYHRFFEYGNAESYHRDLAALRQALRPTTEAPRPANTERRLDEQPLL